ncbi:hypothetical protein EWB00_001519 [Schistosoma japonicum]|uniref:Uncharacterized protein n=1 Tax=Schistosoma japonicum TaxID=6182 RepID=A0A4Z2CK38_SCHJA|nr:hypothetical protein EWB00_001519 [Schistosoma japonicum]
MAIWLFLGQATLKWEKDANMSKWMALAELCSADSPGIAGLNQEKQLFANDLASCCTPVCILSDHEVSCGQSIP